MLRRQLSVILAAFGTVLLAGCGASAAANADRHGTPKTPAHRPSTPPGPSTGTDGLLATRTGTMPAGQGPAGSITDTGTRAVALTFDDGPSPRWTPKYLSLLAKYHIHATFCLIGEQVEEYPQLVADIVQAGHGLCNHSWDHDEYLNQGSTAHIRAEMSRTLDAIHRAVPGVPVRYYRQPGGNWSDTIVATARSYGMTPLDWSVDPSDWKRPPVHDIVRVVEHTTHPGSIVLMHDAGGDRSHTYAALHTLLPYLRHRYRLIRL